MDWNPPPVDQALVASHEWAAPLIPAIHQPSEHTCQLGSEAQKSDLIVTLGQVATPGLPERVELQDDQSRPGHQDQMVRAAKERG